MCTKYSVVLYCNFGLVYVVHHPDGLSHDNLSECEIVRRFLVLVLRGLVLVWV